VGVEWLYSVVRTHGLSVHLIPEETIRSWALITDDRDLFERIRETDYGAFLEGPGDLRSAVKVEDAVYRVLDRRIWGLLSLVGEDLKEFFETYLAKYDLENLRRVMYYIAGPGEVKPRLIPVGGRLLDRDRAVKARTLRELARAVRHDRLSRLLEEAPEDSDLAELDINLELEYLRMVDEAAERSRRVRREREAVEIVDGYVKRSLLGLALKAVRLGRLTKRISDEVRERIGGVAARAILRARGLEEALENLASSKEYRVIALASLSTYREVGEPWVLEICLGRDIVRGCSILVKRAGVISTSFLIYYMLRVEWEALLLKTLLLGRIGGVPPEKLYEAIGERI